MPPSKHSGSSRSAHKDSDQTPSDQNYTLGDYSFRIERSAGTSPNYDKIEAICTKGGKNARKSIQIPSTTKIDGWYVEANETEASVYIIAETNEQPKVPQKSFSGSSAVTVYDCNEDTELFYWSYESHWGGQIGYFPDAIIYSKTPQTVTITSSMPLEQGGYTGTYAVTSLNSNGTYWANIDFNDGQGKPSPIYGPVFLSIDAAGASVSAGPAEYLTKDMLVGRFAIELEDAGGVGPGSDWDDPGDYDDDWEEGDPTHTLYVTVTGALSGRHNDPLNDTSYSYIPSDKDTVKQYGCGGDGGHGGGGGAGASTVVVHKFATNQANSKEVTAIARRHGYGSGGGKGGKGGDGCILVYY